MKDETEKWLNFLDISRDMHPLVKLSFWSALREENGGSQYPGQGISITGIRTFDERNNFFALLNAKSIKSVTLDTDLSYLQHATICANTKDIEGNKNKTHI